MTKILIVEDESSFSEALSFLLGKEGYEVDVAETGTEAIKKFNENSADLILLDLMIPEISGVEVCKTIRTTSQVPIIMLTAKDSEIDKVVGLELGADDYVTKPFGTAELLARLKAIQRRKSSHDEPEITLGALKIDLLQHAASLADEPIKLTPTEFALLKLLARNAGKVVTQKQILREVWPSTTADAGHSLRVHVNHLRIKLGEALQVKNEPGIGYRLELR
jgi:two-component system response regulator RegX3